MKLLMLPKLSEVGTNNGIGQVIQNYWRYLPRVGIELTDNPDDNYDLSSSHLGKIVDADIVMLHGLWFGKVGDLQAQQNAMIIESMRNAKAIIVPSMYVAETIMRDLRISPYVIGHGVNMQDWKGAKPKGYVLWNKNRPSDVCNPEPVYELAKRFPKVKFVTTFFPMDKGKLENVEIIGKVSFEKMQTIIKGASVYLSTAKETFNISCLENLACGTPTLGWNWGGTADLIFNKKDGYLVNVGDYDALSEGLEWLLQNRQQISAACKNKAMMYNWLDVAKKIREVCEYVRCNG